LGFRNGTDTPWITDSCAAAPSNLAFDGDLKGGNPEVRLRTVEDFAGEAAVAALS